MNTPSQYNMLDPDIARGLDALVNEVAKVVNAKRRCCLTCEHWNYTKDGCRLANDQVPPPKVVAFGCPAYVEDPIPF